MIPLDYNVISTPIVEFTRRMLDDTPPGMRRTYASAGDTGLRLRDVALGGNSGMYPKLTIGDKASDFRFKTPWDDEVKFYDAVGNNPAVLIFCAITDARSARWKWQK